MSTLDCLILSALLVFIVVTLIWAYRKRHRLFFQSKFTAETTMMNFADEHKRTTMEAVQYMNEEAEEDESGEKK